MDISSSTSAMPSMDNMEMKIPKLLLDMFDTDGDKGIDSAEMAKMFGGKNEGAGAEGQGGKSESAEQEGQGGKNEQSSMSLSDMMEMFDENGDGKLDAEEFGALLKMLMTGEKPDEGAGAGSGGGGKACDCGSEGCGCSGSASAGGGSKASGGNGANEAGLSTGSSAPSDLTPDPTEFVREVKLGDKTVTLGGDGSVSKGQVDAAANELERMYETSPTFRETVDGADTDDLTFTLGKRGDNTSWGGGGRVFINVNNLEAGNNDTFQGLVAHEFAHAAAGLDHGSELDGIEDAVRREA